MFFKKKHVSQGSYLMCCIGGCLRAAPPPRCFASLLLTGGQRGADGRGQPGPAPPEHASLQPPWQLPLPCFSCIPQPRLLPVSFVKAPSLFHLLERLPKARPGTATVAFKGYTSRIIFITIFIQCLSRRCTDPLQWRKKRTQNLFSKDIQIS